MSEAQMEYFEFEYVRRFIVAIPPWVNSLSKALVMPTFAIQTMFLIDYYTCIRPYAEIMRLRKPDFDLQGQILTASNMKGRLKKTTIPLPLVPVLERYLADFNDREPLFEGSRKTFHNWVKHIGEYAKIPYREDFEIRTIQGTYLYLFKHAYTQRLEHMHCLPSNISVKDRHSGFGKGGMAIATTNYARSIRSLMFWENQNITETWKIVEGKRPQITAALVKK